MHWRDLHDYWFGDIQHETEYFGPRLKTWFVAPKETDDEIRQRFVPALELYTRGALRSWMDEPRGVLTLILLLDQVPRNTFRGTPESFAFDNRALAIAEDAIAQGVAAGLDWVEEMFLFLPFEHSEDMCAQERSISLFRAWAARAPERLTELGSLVLDYAIRHAVVIERFGRYPHRNVILGRSTTPVEVEFLRNHPEGF